MAIITSEDKKTTANTINSSNLEQLDSVFSTTKNLNNSAESLKSSSNGEIELKTKTAAKKKDNSDTLLLNLPKGERSKFKAFCALNDITMTDFIYFSMDFVKDMVEDQKLSVGRSGIKILSKD